MLKDARTTTGLDHELQDERRRRSLGIYYTPSNAAQILARWAIRKRNDTVLEPSFGGCSLLGAAVERLRELGTVGPATRLYGYDVDSGAFAHLSRLLGREFDSQSRFARGDFLLAHPTSMKPVSAIIANPPFVSWHRMNGQQREVVRLWRKRYAASFPMTASLWAYFLIHAIEFLALGGRLAFVLPASALTADYGSSVLSLLARRFRQVYLFRLNEQLFIQAGAQERTVLLLAEQRLGADALPLPFRDRTVSSLEELNEAVTSSANDIFPTVNNNPNTDARNVLEALRARGNLCSLGDSLKVTIGEVVGDSRFFVKTTSAWESIGIESRNFPPLLTGTKQVSGLKVSARDVDSSYSMIPRLLNVPSRRISRKIQEYLNSYPPASRKVNVTFAKRNPWHSVSYDGTAKAFVGSLSHDSPRILLNSAHISCANGLYKLSPQPGMPWRVALSAACLSTITQLSAEVHARALGSGALKLEPSDIRRLELPISYLQLSSKDANQIVSSVDKLLRAGEREAAVRLVDETLLVARGIVTAQGLRAMRNQLESTRFTRVGRAK